MTVYRLKTGSITRAKRSKRQRVQDVVHACETVLRRKVGLESTRPVGCGVQGCVYRTRIPAKVVKVSLGSSHEAGPVMWQWKRGWDSHWSLPRIYRVAKLTSCAGATGRDKIAYVTVRENLHPLPHLRHRDTVDDLVTSLERAFRRGALRNGVDTVEWLTRRSVAERMQGLTMFERQVVLSIAHLAAWLSVRGIILRDMHLGNLAVRRRGGFLDVVVRDIGFMEPRPGSRAVEDRERFSERYVRRHAANLGVFLPE